MRKYVFSIVLALCLVAALLPGIPAAADGHNHTCLCGAENCTQTGTGHEKIPDDAVWEGIGEDKFKTFEIGEAVIPTTIILLRILIATREFWNIFLRECCPMPQWT